MTAAPARLSARLLSTACLLIAVSAPASAQTNALTPNPAPTVPGEAVPPGQDIRSGNPADEAEAQAGQGALISILQASRPDYDPSGVRLGGFVLDGSADLSETYTSNVYAATLDPKTDFFTKFAPSVSLRSGWNRDFLGASANGEIIRYARYVSENVSNFNGNVDGRLDILQGMYVNGNAGYQILHEPRGSANDVNGRFPTEYHVATGSIGYVKDNAVIGIKIDASINNYSYFDVPSAAGTPINERVRDRTEYEISGRVSYEIARQYRAFIRASGNERDYSHKIDIGGFQRSSTGYEFDAGAALSISSKIDAEIYAGYISQSFDDPRLNDVGGVGFGANLLWNVTGLTSIRASAARTVEETIVTQASSFLQTAVSVGVEHELMRNVLLTASFNYADQDYQDFGRVDDIYGVSVGAKYLLNRNISAGLNVGYTSKVSNAVGKAQLAEYDQALVALMLRLQF